ncbi:MAG: hypothetical protein WKF96_00035 [Solirubrobacteraceae bacterium]
MNPGLERSREVRAARVRVKQKLAAPGQRAASWRLAADLIERPSQIVLGMRTNDLLLATACTGPDAVDWLLDLAGARGHLTIRDLRPGERRVLCFALRAGGRRQTRQALGTLLDARRLEECEG